MTSPKEKRGAKEYLADMRDAIRAGRGFLRGVTFEEFRNNREKQFASIHARKIHERDGETETCPVCGELCAVKMVNELFGTKGKKTGKRKL